MRLRVFSVYDHKAKAYLPPFFMGEQGQAIRSFKDAVNSDGHQFCRHPEDYTLFEIGDFNDSTGELTPHKAELLCNALMLVKGERDESQGSLPGLAPAEVAKVS